MTLSPYPLASAVLDTLESATAYNAAVPQGGKYLQELLLGFNQEGATIAPAACVALPWTHRNLLANGGFDLNSRGSASYDASAVDVAAADGWRASWGVWSRDTATTDGSAASLKCVPDATHLSFVRQTVYEIEQYRGKKVSAWGRARGAPGTLFLDDVNPADNLNVASATHDATSGWTTFSATITVRGDATALELWWQPTALSTPFWLDNFMLTATDGPVAFVPEQPALAKFKARRRYWAGVFSCRFRSVAAGGVEEYFVPIPAPMLGFLSASIALTGVAGVDYSNVSSLAVTQADATGFLRVAVTPTAASTGTWAYKQPLVIDAGIY